MYIAEIEQGITGNCLVICTESNTNVGYISKMIFENQICGLLPCTKRIVNGKEQFVYDICSKISLFNLFEHNEIKYSDLYKIIAGIETITESMEEYLLNDDYLILNPEYIYMDIDSGKISMCYFPCDDMVLADEMKLFAEYILQHVDHNDEPATKMAYEFYKMVLKGDFYFKRLLKYEESMTKQVSEIETQPTPENEIIIDEECLLPFDDKIGEEKIPEFGKWIIGACLLSLIILSSVVGVAYIYKPVNLTELFRIREFVILLCVIGAMSIFIPIIIISKWMMSKINYRKRISELKKVDESEYYKSDKEENPGKTESFAKCEDVPRLVQLSGETIKEFLISKTPFVIGKKVSMCDGVINNIGISRMHAKITKEGDCYFVMDLNSTNGTFINGQRILGNQKMPLSINDEVKFGSDMFYFR